ncbi:hypothetical protein CASFOL_002457 [Castilleja foliolosa]|uniref:Uncharacterized protein n=1 Tax=Castilleja foliolosa TaxID=1961234 RepID=A0ABD3EEL2_9LAMI
MGNCIEKSNNRPQTEEIKEKSGNMRIKIMLTRKELEVLMAQLENKQGKKVEDVLNEIQKNRDKSWKPSLDTITESPEVAEIMDR